MREEVDVLCVAVCVCVCVWVGRTRQAKNFAWLLVQYQSLTWLSFGIRNSWLLLRADFSHTLAHTLSKSQTHARFLFFLLSYFWEYPSGIQELAKCDFIYLILVIRLRSAKCTNTRLKSISFNEFLRFSHGALLDFHDCWFVLSVVNWIWIWNVNRLAPLEAFKVVGFRHAIAPPSPCPNTTTTTTESHWRRTLGRRWECMEIFRAASSSGFNLGKASLSLIAARERRPKAPGARGRPYAPFRGLKAARMPLLLLLSCWWWLREKGRAPDREKWPGTIIY